MNQTPTLLEIVPRDISAYRKGNTGIDYVHRFESGRPGPHVLISSLIHGNEICGMYAATYLLDKGVRPKIGTLTVSFANVEAYEAFDPEHPFENRQLVHNMNRIWSPELLDGSDDSPELRRARLLRPVLDQADHILDIHSTSQDVAPFWAYIDHERNRAVASAIGRPSIHLVMPGGLGTGKLAIEYVPHGLTTRQGTALVIECGQHFRSSAAEMAITVTHDFLAHFGLIAQDPATLAPSAERRYELLQTHMVKADNFAFTRPLVGFETFAKGELIAINGTEEIRAPCDDCTVFLPTRAPIIGREAVVLTRPL
ncbi:succinylglutamate desuccinylase/aspartoacylase family protein [Paraburkholderia nemoris]|uniref:succinylglutamate desuccinylase/aspartoacylase domain-containing protein n=1 Tax=Paraburkholderia nemoris TaxID=2793076 RepID=UPI0038BD1720